MFLVYGNYNHDDPRTAPFSIRYERAFSIFNASRLSKEIRVVRSGRSQFTDYEVVHSPDYVHQLESVLQTGLAQGRIEPAFVEFENSGVGGTLESMRLAVSHRCFVYHLGGGFHHGMSDKPESVDFCNDIAICIGLLLRQGMTRILFIDLDAHHPNGVQAIFESDPRVCQVSMHAWEGGRAGYFNDSGIGNALGSKINLPLPLHTGDETYLLLLESLLPKIAKIVRPEVIVYQAGLDPHWQDPIGCLNLSLAGLYLRDLLVANLAKALKIPLITVLGGGYNHEIVGSGVQNTLAALSGHSIQFREEAQNGASTRNKALRWLDELKKYLNKIGCLGSNYPFETI